MVKGQGHDFGLQCFSKIFFLLKQKCSNNENIKNEDVYIII